MAIYLWLIVIGGHVAALVVVVAVAFLSAVAPEPDDRDRDWYWDEEGDPGTTTVGRGVRT